MRKFGYVFLILTLSILASCSSKEATNNADEKKTAEAKKDSVSVDKGLMNVEVTLPASMFEDDDIDTVIANAKKDGVKEVTKNEDGSLTYKMSKAKHKEMMQELETGIKESIEETKSSGDFASIKDVTYNDSFSEFTLIVDRAAYENSMDGFAIYSYGISGMLYQIYSGVDDDAAKVKIFTKDEATQEIFDETVYPDDMEEADAE